MLLFESLSHAIAQSNHDGKSVIVIDVDVWSILGIYEVEEIFKVQFKMSITWRDPRLNYQNLKEDSFINIVSHEEENSIWFPQVVSLNTEHLEKSIVSRKYLGYEDGKSEYGDPQQYYNVNRYAQNWPAGRTFFRILKNVVATHISPFSA